MRGYKRSFSSSTQFISTFILSMGTIRLTCYEIHTVTRTHKLVSCYRSLSIYPLKTSKNLFQTIKTPERGQWRRSGVFIVNLEQVFRCFQEVQKESSRMIWVNGGLFFLFEQFLVLPSFNNQYQNIIGTLFKFPQGFYLRCSFCTYKNNFQSTFKKQIYLNQRLTSQNEAGGDK